MPKLKLDGLKAVESVNQPVSIRRSRKETSHSFTESMPWIPAKAGLMRHMGRTLIRCFLGMVVVSLRSNLVTAAVSVAPLVETGPSHHTGDTADDSVIWVHPTDPSQSVVIGDDKNGGMMVWNLDGSELQYIDGSKLLNNVDLRYNFPLSGQYSDGVSHSQVTLVTVGNENGNALTFYKVNPATRKLESAGEFGLSISTPYGGCMYRSPVTGKYYYFVNWKSGVWQQVEVFANGSTVTGIVVRTHDAGGQTEGCVTDDIHQYYYIGEEPAGVWRYGAEPSAGTTRVQVDKTGAGGRLTADVEGMSLYYKSDGSGYLIVSSQGSSTFQVYQRQPPSAAVPNAFLGEFSVGASGAIDAVSGTDGLDVTNFPLGSNYPQGLLVVHDAANSGGSASNHKLVPWERVAQALSLTSDTSWDPRLVGRSGSLPTPSRTPTPGGPTATRTPTPGVCTSTLANQGDANCDCTVSGVDYAIWLFHYRQSTGNGFRDGDFNGDGTVTGVDYAIWLAHYRQTCSGPTPTPPTGATNTPTPTPGGPTPTRTPTPSVGPSPTPPTAVSGIWATPTELVTLPTSGAAWQAVYNAASGSWGTADISNQDSGHDVNTLAGALVCVRTGEFCDKARAAVVSAINTENGGRWLAVGRNLTSYVIAADLLNLRSGTGSDGDRVEAWLRSFLTKTLQHNNDASRQVQFPVFESGSNASAEQGAGYSAVAAYLGDRQALEYAWNRFRLYSCDPSSPEQDINIGTGIGGNWTYTDSAHPRPCAVNPASAPPEKAGAIVNDMVRGGSFHWPPGYTQYPWVGLEGYVPAALILHRAGYPAFQLEDRAVLRALQYLKHVRDASGNSSWFDGSRSNETIYLVNKAYGVSLPVNLPTGGGRTIGFTDWTHQNGI